MAFPNFKKELARRDWSYIVGFALGVSLILAIAFMKYGPHVVTPSPYEPPLKLTLVDPGLFDRSVGLLLLKAPDNKVTVIAQEGELAPFRQTELVAGDVPQEEWILVRELDAGLASNLVPGVTLGKRLAVVNKTKDGMRMTITVQVLEDTGLCSGLRASVYVATDLNSQLLITAPLTSFNGEDPRSWFAVDPGDANQLQFLIWLGEENSNAYQGQSCTVETFVVAAQRDLEE